MQLLNIWHSGPNLEKLMILKQSGGTSCKMEGNNTETVMEMWYFSSAVSHRSVEVIKVIAASSNNSDLMMMMVNMPNSWLHLSFLCSLWQFTAVLGLANTPAPTLQFTTCGKSQCKLAVPPCPCLCACLWVIGVTLTRLPTSTTIINVKRVRQQSVGCS